MMTDQQVVIIGGSEGIGLAVARAARTVGANVLAVARTLERLEIAQHTVSGLEIHVADINDLKSIEGLFSKIQMVDHVYIAAGSTKTGGPLDHPLHDFRRKFDERLWGSLDVGSCFPPSCSSWWFFHLYRWPCFRPPCKGGLGLRCRNNGNRTAGASSRT